jgi:hypothetical protein
LPAGDPSEAPAYRENPEACPAAHACG